MDITFLCLDKTSELFSNTLLYLFRDSNCRIHFIASYVIQIFGLILSENENSKRGVKISFFGKKKQIERDFVFYLGS